MIIKILDGGGLLGSPFKIRARTLFSCARRRLGTVCEPGARMLLDAENVAHARAAGADEVIETTRLGFSMLAHALIVPGSATIMSRMADAPAHSLFVDPISESIETPAPFEEVRRRVKAEHGAMVIDFRRPGRRDDQINPSDDVIVPPGSLLVYIADDHALV